MLIRDLAPFSPASFFDFSIPIYPKKQRAGTQNSFLPLFSHLLHEEAFAKVELSWSHHGLHAVLLAEVPLQGSSFPDFRLGDSFELFIHTVGAKQTSILTRFCHHFVFLPEEVEGIQIREVTRFRSEDSRDYANPSLFHLKVEPKRKQYKMTIEMPKAVLHGYDPELLDQIGFGYRINRMYGEPQHLSVSSRFFALEKHPDLWAMLRLKK